jgi:multiple sugar transport system substrate-binding protein
VREVARSRARSRAALAVAALAIALAAGGCARSDSRVETIRFWAMGREGEVVEELVRDFEREHPGIHVVVQQIPWGAAHEKLLTAHVGGSTPDAAQLGNTWVAEFAALNAIEPLGPWIRSSRDLKPAAYFPGIWDTNVIDSIPYGIPWYVDTRVLFYRRDLLERAGYRAMPTDWADWVRCMEAVRRAGGPGHFAIFLPTNEYTPWIIFGLQAGSHLLKDDDTRGDFSGSANARAVAFYLDVYRRGLAPAIQGAAIGNLYQEFERGTFAMYITGPWNLGEFRNRLSPALQSAWATAPLPGPDGPSTGVSVAGGSSLVLFRHSRHQAAAWKLIEFLSRPEQQLRFWRLTGDLPGRREAWADTALTRDPNTRAFEVQLTRAVSTPKVPEWEEISNRLQDSVGAMLLGHARPDSALAALDRSVDVILEKRRWLIERDRRRAALEPKASR